jgi:chromate transporter
LSPFVAGTLGAFITTWTTFVPCFLWIFLGAPHLEQLRRNANVKGALSSVTAAVVGVILNLAVWFAGNVLFHETPSGRSIDGFALVIVAIGLVGLWRWKWNILVIVIGAGAAGLVHGMIVYRLVN